MTNIEVKPWIGQQYSSPSLLPFRTLVLGESNYTEPKKYTSDLVINCVRDAIEGTDAAGFGRFSTKVIRIIFGANTPIHAEEFWHNVAFFNFVEQLVGTEARQRPTAEMWNASLERFTILTAALAPERILVLGKANWKNLLAQVPQCPVDSYQSNLQVSPTIAVLAGYTNHPSSSIRYATWNPRAKALLFPTASDTGSGG
jgi:hypothetical protein